MEGKADRDDRLEQTKDGGSKLCYDGMTFTLVGDWVSSVRLGCIMYDVVLLLQSLENWYDQRSDVICCVFTIFAQHESSLSSQALLQMCPHPSCHVSAIESEMSDDEEAQCNIWDKMLELFTLQGSSPVLQSDLEDCELCRVA